MGSMDLFANQSGSFDDGTIIGGGYQSTLTANTWADSSSGMVMTLTPGGAGTTGTASANYSTQANAWVAVTAYDNGTFAPAGASGTSGLRIDAMSSSGYQAGSTADMTTTAANTEQSVWFTTQQSAGGWQQFQHNETVGYTPTGRSGMYNTTANSHAESEYEMDAEMTTDYDGGDVTSYTFLHYHAKGSGSADGMDWEFGLIDGESTTGMYRSYATGQDEYLVEMHYFSESDSHFQWATGHSSSHSETDFTESDMGDSGFTVDEAGVFDGSRVAGSYASSSRSNDSIDYVGSGQFHSESSSQTAEGATMTWTFDNNYEYTGVGEFHSGSGDSGGFNPDGDTGMAYAGSSATVVTTYENETTFHATTDMPSRTFYYGQYSWTQPGWSSWSDSYWKMESEATFDASAIAWSDYNPASASDGSFSEEGLDTTDTYTWISTYSYTGPAGHIFEQSFGSTTTTTHTSSTTGTPPTDPAVIAAMSDIANQSAGQNNFQNTSQSNNPIPAAWLATLSDLEDFAEAAYNNPTQLAALTDAAFAELTAMDDPENPGTPIVQALAAEGGDTSSPPDVWTLARQERQRIEALARQWYEEYKGKWPQKNCEGQAMDLADYLRQRGPWKYWTFKGVSGTRFGFGWPGGYGWFRFRECENAVGVFFTKPGIIVPGFVIDGFHDYNNRAPWDLPHSKRITTLEEFFKKWYMNPTVDSWSDKPIPWPSRRGGSGPENSWIWPGTGFFPAP